MNLHCGHYIMSTFHELTCRSLTEFVNGRNSHSIRTASHKTPNQLFTAGSLMLHNASMDALDIDNRVDENYGIDPDCHLPTDSESCIVVPENRITFSDVDTCIRALKQTIDPLSASDNHGIDIYEQTLQYISTLQQL